MIRTAKGLSNLPEAKAIRAAVFIDEQGFHNEFDDIDDRAVHVVCFARDNPSQPVACGRCFEDGRPGEHRLGRIAVLKPFRGSDYGRRIVETLEAEARRAGAQRAVLSSQLQAAGFYSRLGYAAVGEPYLDEHCPHIAMQKDLCEPERIR